jgi:hypothetical protein
VSTRTAVSSWSPQLPAVAVERRVAPAEVALAAAPFAAVPWAVWASAGPFGVFALGALSSLWGMVRLARDRSLSRVALATVFAPLSFGLTVTGWMATVTVAEAIGLRPAAAGAYVIVGSVLAAATALCGWIGSAWMARRSVADARVLLYLQAFPFLVCMATIEAGRFFALAAPITVSMLWGASLVRYLTGDDRTVQRVGKQLRAGSALLLAYVLIAAVFAPYSVAGDVMAALAVIPALLFLDARMERTAASEAPLLEEE